MTPLKNLWSFKNKIVPHSTNTDDLITPSIITALFSRSPLIFDWERSYPTFTTSNVQVKTGAVNGRITGLLFVRKWNGIQEWYLVCGCFFFLEIGFVGGMFRFFEFYSRLYRLVDFKVFQIKSQFSFVAEFRFSSYSVRIEFSKNRKYAIDICWGRKISLWRNLSFKNKHRTWRRLNLSFHFHMIQCVITRVT